MKNSNLHSNAPNAQGANERAQLANSFAKQARSFRDTRNSLLSTLQQWEQIMIDSPIILLTIAFIILAIVEIIISWKAYGELQASILSVPNPILSVFIGLMIVSLGAVVSHYIAKRLSGSIFDLEVFNMRHKSNNSMPASVAEEKVRIKTRNHLIIGLILFVILIAGVLMISLQRVGLMGAITGQTFGMLQKLLPVIVVTLEVFCGIYLGYFFRRIFIKRKIKAQQNEFVEKKDSCAYETRMCKECYDHSISRNESISYNRELRDSLYRFEYRSQDNDYYIDEIPVTKSVKVLVMDEGKIMQGVHLFGLLPGNEYTNAIWTNESGEAVLEWQNNEEYLSSIMINNHQHQGPFRNNSNIRIELENLKLLKAVG